MGLGYRWMQNPGAHGSLDVTCDLFFFGPQSILSGLSKSTGVAHKLATANLECQKLNRKRLRKSIATRESWLAPD